MKESFKTRNIQLLRKIDQIFGSSYDLHKVIVKIYREIGKVLDTGNFYIALYNRADNTVSFEIYTIEGKEMRPKSRRLSKGLTEHVIRSKKPLRINSSYRKACEKLKIEPRGKDAKSWLGVPMIYKNNVEGVITIQDYRKENVYSAEDESFLLSIASRAAVVIANTKLIDEKMKRAQELSLMNKIADRLTRSLKIDTICGSIARSITQNFKNYNISIFLVEHRKVVLKKLSRNFRDEITRDLRVKFGEKVMSTIIKTGETIVANDISKTPLYRFYGYIRVKSGICIPLRIATRTIGVMNIDCDEQNAFDEETVRTLELIADLTSVALHNAQLTEDAGNQSKELAVSFTIARSLISTLALDEVLREILDVIANTFGYTSCAVLLTDPEANRLYIKASHGYPRSIRYIMRDQRLKSGRKGICAHVAATGKPYYASDVSKDPYYVAGKKSVRSEAAVPLKMKDEVIGVLDIESEKLDAFSERDLRMFSVFASQAAIAIENDRLYNEIRALSLTDSLSKAANRRHFDLMLDSEIKKAKGYSRPLSLAMIDLDDFKAFNDKYGHLAGDKILIHISRTLRKNVRDTDFVARYGGEEFTIILPETSNAFAMKVSERVRCAVEKNALNIKGLGKKKMTISIGVASFPDNADNAAELIHSADRALYRAKQMGKNCVAALE